MQSVTKDANVGAVILNSDQILLVKNKAEWKNVNGKKFFKPSKWGLPNGRRESGETEIETAIRETKEETGFLIRIDPNIKVEEDMGDRTNFTFLGYIVGGHIEVCDEGITDCRWFPVHSLPPDMYFSHQQRLSQLLGKIQKSPSAVS